MIPSSGYQAKARRLPRQWAFVVFKIDTQTKFRVAGKEVYNIWHRCFARFF